jgi:diguanylate cyclase (GGDEF)-like protein/PAS domain S-box-containing protein
MNFRKEDGAIDLQAKAPFLAAIVRSSNEAIISTDFKGNILSWNKEAEKLYGYSEQEVLGRPVSLIIPAGYIKDLFKVFDQIKAGEGISDFESVREQRDGLRIDVSSNIFPIRDENGKIIAAAEISHDITSRKLAEEAKKKIQQHLEFEKQKLIETLSINQKIISILDLNDLVDFVIEKVTDLLGAQRCSLMFLDGESRELTIKGAKGLSRSVIKNTHVKVGEGVAGFVAETGKPLLVSDVELEKAVVKHVRRYRGKSFLSMPVQLKGRIVGVVNVTDKSSNGLGDVFTETDLNILSAITRQAEIAFENSHLYKELRYQSITDPLTGLYNHRFFVRCLNQEMKRVNRYAGDLTLMMIDVDGFKKYNDRYGHVEGDNLLKMIAKILKSNLRRVDILCRYGGDEFGIILPDTDVAQSRTAAEKLKKAVEDVCFKEGITLSIGLASYQKDMDRYDFVMQADEALYAAKRTGKNKVCSR